MSIHPISIESAGGEYMESVLVVSWTVRPGDRVKAGQLLVVVETAKAATEIESDRDGWLAEIHFPEGQEAPVGAVLGTISDTQSEPPPAAAPRSATVVAMQSVTEPAGVQTAKPRATGDRMIASPLARRVARQEGLDLAAVTGTGPHGRIKKRDVLASLAEGGDLQRVAASRSPSTPARATGPRDPLILIHGFGADRSAWRQVAPLLPGDFEIVTIDLPGHGARAAVEARTIEDFALDIAAQLEVAGIERAHIAGHSLGAAAALLLTGLGGVTVRSLTLLAPAGLGPDINHDFLRGLTRASTPEALARWLTVMVGDERALPPGYAKAVLRQLDRIGNRQVLEALAGRLFPEGTQAFNLQPILARLHVPARILWGRRDRVVPPSHAASASGGVAVHMLDGVGHTAQLEVPDLVARLIAETVRSAG